MTDHLFNLKRKVTYYLLFFIFQVLFPVPFIFIAIGFDIQNVSIPIAIPIAMAMAMVMIRANLHGIARQYPQVCLDTLYPYYIKNGHYARPDRMSGDPLFHTSET